MTNQHDGPNVKGGLRSRSLMIAVAVAVLALLAVILIARNSGDEGGASTPATEAAGLTNNDGAAGAGLGGAVPGYGEPNRPPTTSPADGTGMGTSGETTGPTANGTSGPAPQG